MQRIVSAILSGVLFAALSARAAEAESPAEIWAQAQTTGSVALYERVIREFPEAIDSQASGWWPEKPPVKFADNARIHLLNHYVDWEQRNIPKDIPRAQKLALEILKRPNGLYAVDLYTGYTRPHTLLILASLTGDQRERMSFYLRIAREHWGEKGGALGKDGAFWYGPVAKRLLSEMASPMDEANPLKKKITRALAKMPQ